MNSTSSSSLTPGNSQYAPQSRGTLPLGNTLPIAMIILGVLILFAVLSVPARAILRKRLVPLPSPNLPPSGAAPWSRAQVNNSENAPFAQVGYGMATTSIAPGPMPGGYVENPLYGRDEPYARPGNANFNTPPLMPVANNYTWSQPGSQPSPTTPPVAPITPPLLPRVEAQHNAAAQGPVISPALPGNSYAGQNEWPNSSNAGPGKKLLSYALQTTGTPPPEHSPATLSADMMVMSDPYVQSMLQHYSQKGQPIPPAPGESS